MLRRAIQCSLSSFLAKPPHIYTSPLTGVIIHRTTPHPSRSFFKAKSTTISDIPKEKPEKTSSKVKENSPPPFVNGNSKPLDKSPSTSSPPPQDSLAKSKPYKRIRILDSDDEDIQKKSVKKSHLEGDSPKESVPSLPKDEKEPSKRKKKADRLSLKDKEDTASGSKARKKSKSPKTQQATQKNKAKKLESSLPFTKEKKEDAEEKLHQKSQEESEADNKDGSSEEKEPLSEPTSKVEQKKPSLPISPAADTDYDPSKAKYDPVKDASWKAGEKVPYLAFAITLEKIEATSGRLRMIEILSNFLRSVIALSPEDLLPCIYLCLNKVAPDYAGIELGMGDTVLMKALAQATGRTVDKIKAELAVKGDLGLVAQSSRGTQRLMFTPPKLLVRGVFAKLKEIAHLSGNAAMSKKVDLTKGMFVACRHVEAKYLIRSLSGKLRIGLAEQSLLQALAQALTLGEGLKLSKEEFDKKLEKNALLLKTAYCECPNYDLIISTLLKDGLEALPEKCRITPGIPVKPMLANPTKGVAEVLQRFDNILFTCEYKYDGERAQIHKLENGDIKIYSRSQEDNTSKYPEVLSRLPKSFEPGTESFIMDAEAVAWDPSTQTILPFQILSTRKRKDAVESEIKVQVCIFAFDLLYLNGKSLVSCPFRERRNLLHSAIHEVPNELKFAQYQDLESPDDIQAFLDESVKDSCEGLMIKTLDVEAHYEIAKRSRNWLKLKKDYLEGLGDSLDLVVIGGYFGKGKRTGNYGGFLLACYDEDNEEYQSICKIGTGFKDEDLEEHTKFLKQHVLEGGAKSYYRYDPSLEPDEWFAPEQVWEVKCGDISKSPVHRAAIGIVDPEKGVSLRFPRFIRVRTDKKPEQATSSSQVAKMYHDQKQIKNISSASTGKALENEDEDMY